MTFDILAAFAGLKSNTKLTIPAGIYNIPKTLLIPDGLQDVTIEANGQVALCKAVGFTGEYLLYGRHLKNTVLRGFDFLGLSTAQHFGEQGVYFGSCNGTEVDDCQFGNFGDAALRITTSMTDAPGTWSTDAWVHGCKFDKIQQVTVTSNSDQHGGTIGYVFEDNILTNLFGSLKFGTRIPCGGATIRNNVIAGSLDKGIEIAAYSNVKAYGNIITGTKNAAVFVDVDSRAPKGFAWGDLSFTNNIIGDCGQGVRVGNSVFKDGTHIPMAGLEVQRNTMYHLAGRPLLLCNGDFTMPKLDGNVVFAVDPTPAPAVYSSARAVV
jgi:hypothetical protein